MQLVVIATCYSLGSGYFSWTGNVPLVPLLSFYIAIASSAFFFFLCISSVFLTPLCGHSIKQLNFMFCINFSA